MLLFFFCRAIIIIFFKFPWWVVDCRYHAHFFERDNPKEKWNTEKKNIRYFFCQYFSVLSEFKRKDIKMPPKSKVKFTEAQSAIKKDGGGNTAPNSPNNSDNVVLQQQKTRKSKKASKVANDLVSSTSEFNDGDFQLNEDGNSAQDSSSLRLGRRSRKSNAVKEIGSLVLLDCDKNVSDGSIDDEEVPEVEWPPLKEEEEDGEGGVCSVRGGGGEGVGGSEEQDNDAAEETNDGNGEEASAPSCGVGVRLTVSQKVTPCMKSDDQAFSTTDYKRRASAGLGLLPNLIHPVNGQVSVKFLKFLFFKIF